MTRSSIVLITIGVIVFGLVAGAGVRYFRGTQATDAPASPDAVVSTTPIAKISDDKFAWGVTVLSFPFPTYRPEFNKTQIAEAKNLGLNYVRVDYVPNNPGATDSMVAAANEAGIKVVLIIPFGPKDIFSNKTLEADTASYVGDVVKRYKGKVAVYQLATEVASVALRNNSARHGIALSDYANGDLNAVATWVRVAAETVKKDDPGVPRLMNDQWVHTGFFDYYFSHGGDIDIIGWNWFSDMGTSFESPTLDQKTNQHYALLNKLKGYGKPIWITELNRRMGSQGGNEKAQADYISTMVKNFRKDPAVQGIFIFNLIEDQAAPAQEKGYGIVNATDDGTTQKVTGHKRAYDALQDLIKAAK